MQFEVPRRANRDEPALRREIAYAVARVDVREVVLTRHSNLPIHRRGRTPQTLCPNAYRPAGAQQDQKQAERSESRET